MTKKEQEQTNPVMRRRLRWAVISGISLACLIIGFGQLLTIAAGNSSHEPEEAEWLLGESARALIDQAYSGIEPGSLRDHHTHLIGLGSDPEKSSVHPDAFSWLHPKQRLRTSVYLPAAGITDLAMANEQYVARLVRLIRAMPGFGRHHLLAFDKHYLSDGQVDEQRTQFYVSNDYVMEIAERYPDIFIPVVSIHPYRIDAIEALDEWAEKGVRIVKWLPNAQGMNPADPMLLPFYKTMKAHNMALLTHAGEEQAVEADEQQSLGNPLHLRVPLDAGVKVIVAHAASLGESKDLDDPQQPQVENYKLFMRLMDEKRYEGLLFGEISATTLITRIPDALQALLQRPDLHHRLVNGSDYPIPAVNVLIDLTKIADTGMLQQTQIEPLREIYGFNPLLFDFVLKRSLRLPHTELGFSNNVFVANKALGD